MLLRTARVRPVSVVLALFLLVAGDVRAEETRQRVGIDDPVRFADILTAHRRYAKAEEFIRWVLTAEAQTLSATQKRRLQYLLGVALAGLRQFAEAEEILRTLLDTHPHSTAVRLALGQVLFARGNDDASRRQLDLVLADTDADEATRQSALRYVAAIEERNGWFLSGSFSLRQNNNANAAPQGSDRVLYLFGLPFRSNVQPKDTTTAHLTTTAQHRTRLAEAVQWESAFSIAADIESGRWDKSVNGSVWSGPRFLFPHSSSSVGAALLASHRWEYGQPIADTFGFRVDGNRVFAQRYRLGGVVQYHRHNAQGSRADDALVYYAQGRLDTGFSPLMSGYAEVSARRNEAKSQQASHTTLAAGAGVSREFPYGISGRVSFSASRTLNDGVEGIIGIRHRYLHRNWTVSLLKRDWRLWGSTPQLSYTVNNRASNIPINRYQNRALSLNLTKNF